MQRPDRKFAPKTWFSSEDENDYVVKLSKGDFKDFMTTNYRVIDSRVKKNRGEAVSAGNLMEDTIHAINTNSRVAMSPFFTRNKETNKKGIMMRQCTQDYKIAPLIKEIRRLLGVGFRKRVPKDAHVVQLFGISIDEASRMRSAPKKYLTYDYPLIDLKISRKDCFDWMEKNKYPKPPRSACTFCPFHSDSEWKYVKQDKEEWDKVVAFDKKIRNGWGKVKDNLYLHKSGKPIDEVNFDEVKDDQLNLFENECEGQCGI
jgi:hypothetical protein